MKALKGMFIYILVLVGIVIMLGLFLFATMFLFHYKLFGYGVIGHFSNKEVVAAYTPEVSAKKMQVEITANHFDIVVQKGKNFGVSYLDRAMGLYKGNDESYLNGYSYTEYKEESNELKAVQKNSYSPIYYAGDDIIPFSKDESFEKEVKNRANKMVIQLIEPEGKIWYNNCTLKVTLPEDKEYTIILNGGQGDIRLDSKLSYAKLGITTTSGSVSFTDKVDSMTVDELVMKTGNGRFNFSNIKTFMVNEEGHVGQLEITDSGNGKFTFTNLVAAVNIHANGVQFSAEEVYTDQLGFYFDCKKGSLTINVLDSATLFDVYGGSHATYINSISSESASVRLGEVAGDLFVATTKGNVRVDKVRGQTIAGKTVGVADITTTTGNISIGAIKENCVISSTKGDITVSYCKGIKVYSRFGDITVYNIGDVNHDDINYNKEDGLGYERESVEYKTILRTSDGKITAKNLLSACEIESENKGNIYVEFAPLYARNTDGGVITNTNETKYFIKNNKGNIDVVFDGVHFTERFVLELGAKKNKVKGSVGSQAASMFHHASTQVLPTEEQSQGTDQNLYGAKMYIVAGSGTITCKTNY